MQMKLPTQTTQSGPRIEYMRSVAKCQCLSELLFNIDCTLDGLLMICAHLLSDVFLPTPC